MDNNFKNILFLFPVMLYYFFESIVLGLFVSVLWRFFLSELFNLYITYFQWVIIIWIVKVILFDVFKLLAVFSNAAIGLIQQEEKNNKNEND